MILELLWPLCVATDILCPGGGGGGGSGVAAKNVGLWSVTPHCTPPTSTPNTNASAFHDTNKKTANRDHPPIPSNWM